MGFDRWAARGSTHAGVASGLAASGTMYATIGGMLALNPALAGPAAGLMLAGGAMSVASTIIGGFAPDTSMTPTKVEEIAAKLANKQGEAIRQALNSQVSKVVNCVNNLEQKVMDNNYINALEYLVQESNQRLKNTLLHGMGTVMPHLHQAMMVCDDIDHRTQDLHNSRKDVLGAAVKYVAVADEAFNSCKQMAVAYMLGYGFKGHFASLSSVFWTVQNMADSYMSFFTTLYSKAMSDSTLRGWYTYKVFDSYKLKVRNFKNWAETLRKHYQYGRPYPARQSPAGEHLRWPGGWACRYCGKNRYYYDCYEKGRLPSDYGGITDSQCISGGGIWMYDPEISNRKYKPPHQYDDSYRSCYDSYYGCGGGGDGGGGYGER